MLNAFRGLETRLVRNFNLLSYSWVFNFGPIYFKCDINVYESRLSQFLTLSLLRQINSTMNMWFLCKKKCYNTETARSSEMCQLILAFEGKTLLWKNITVCQKYKSDSTEKFIANYFLIFINLFLLFGPGNFWVLTKVYCHTNRTYFPPNTAENFSV